MSLLFCWDRIVKVWLVFTKLYRVPTDAPVFRYGCDVYCNFGFIWINTVCYRLRRFYRFRPVGFADWFVGPSEDILNSRPNRSKNKLVRENAVTRVDGSCLLQVDILSWLLLIPISCKCERLGLIIGPFLRGKIRRVLNKTQTIPYCWFSRDVTKIQTKKLSILPSFYFHEALEQLKTNRHTNFRFKRILGFVIEYAWISKLLRDAAFTWRPRGLSCRLKNDLFQDILLSKQFMY